MQEELERARRARRHNDLRELGKMPQFRRTMEWLLGECRMHSSCFTGNSTTFYNEGRRDIGIALLAELDEACGPELYHQIRRELLSRQVSDLKKLNPENPGQEE